MYKGTVTFILSFFVAKGWSEMTAPFFWSRRNEIKAYNVIRERK
jgi:hypothetical protein